MAIIQVNTVSQIKTNGELISSASDSFMLFGFNELSESAKVTAIEEFKKEYETVPDYWADLICEDFVEQLSAIGISLSKDDVFYSVSFSQGDGASFRGSFTTDFALKDDLEGDFGVENAAKLREYFKRLKALETGCVDHVEGSIVIGSSRYVHSNTMDVEMEFLKKDESGVYCEIDEDNEPENGREEAIKVMRELADDLYKSLDDEMMRLISDEYAQDELKSRFPDALFYENGILRDLGEE